MPDAGDKADETINGDLYNDSSRARQEKQSQPALRRRNIGDYNRDELIAALLEAIGRGWTERDEAIRGAARWLGFQRAGNAIKDAFKSAINGAIRRGRLKYEGSRIRKITQ